MSTIAEFTVPSGDFALHHALAAAPEVIVEIERVVATLGDRVMPYFWVSGGDTDAFEAAFKEDTSIHTVSCKPFPGFAGPAPTNHR